MITQYRIERAYANLRSLGTSTIEPTDLATLTGSLAAPEARALALVAILKIRATEANLDAQIGSLQSIIDLLGTDDEDDDGDQDDTTEEEAGE